MCNQMQPAHAGSTTSVQRAPSATFSGLGDRGDLRARGDVLPLVYRERRRRAARSLRQEQPDHALQPTASVQRHHAWDLLALDEALNTGPPVHR